MERTHWMAASLPYGQPLDIETNRQAVIARMDEARAGNAALLVLPELCLTGCTAGDLAAQPLVLSACQTALRGIVQASEGLAVVLGLPVLRESRVFNAAAVCENGHLKALIFKHTLSSGERRIFTPGGEARGDAGFPCPVFAQGVGAVTLNGGETLTVRFLEDGQPSGSAVSALMHTEPAMAGGAAQRRRRVQNMAGAGVCLWANAGQNESTTDLMFDGQAIIANGFGVLSESAPFDNAFALWDGTAAPVPAETMWVSDPMMPYAPEDPSARALWCREAMEICARALAVRMQRIHAGGATLGLSGGLDSAMALLTALRAFEIMGLPKENLFAVTLPAFGSGTRTRGNADALLSSLDLQNRQIDITRSVSLHFKDIGHAETLHDAAFENAQARERTQVLMDMANSLSGLMIGTGDMSELALGFTTFGGDHMSMYGVNGGLYKTALRLIIAQYAKDTDNAELASALNGILDTPVSPELLPSEENEISQRTEDIVGPYVLNDFFLHHFLVNKLTPEEMLDAALAAFQKQYARAEILRRMRGFFRRFFASQFKRSCMPDGPMALGVSLSPRGGLSMPSDAVPALWLAAIDALQ